jgi:hypothetical protein
MNVSVAEMIHEVMSGKPPKDVVSERVRGLSSPDPKTMAEAVASIKTVLTRRPKSVSECIALLLAVRSHIEEDEQHGSAITVVDYLIEDLGRIR